MKASVSYNDLIGTAAADISDLLTKHNELNELAENFGINIQKYEPFGITFYGPREFSVSFLCVNKVKSNEEKKIISKISVDIEPEEVFDLFKRLEIVLIHRFKQEYVDYRIDEEISAEDLKE